MYSIKNNCFENDIYLVNFKIVEERVVQNINDKTFNNKISLWIKQRLFISKNYNETMTALENFVTTMKKSDEILSIDNEKKQPISTIETEFKENEQLRFNPIIPPLIGKFFLSI